ncbi:ThuA domain-containing protein [Ruminococcaceae bacterium OttesenSCG-928-D13]|nr:ThuA domain-containing protein [Ruminococcaceae bacterium OttesenSCG-928-D13]
MDDKLNILLITGIVTSEHDPKMVPMIRFLLQSTGRFNVKVTEEFTGATAETLAKYDAVLVNYDGKLDVETPFVGWGANAEQALYDYVANGGGAVMYHSSIIKNAHAFPDAYVKLAGCDFDFAAGGRKTPKLEMVVDVDTEAHEITQGSPKHWMTAQEDFFVNMKWLPDVPVTVLATIRDELSDYEPDKIQPHRRYEFENQDLSALPGMGDDVPVAWTHGFGKGRVFSVSIGHGPDTLKRPAFAGLLCRATEWAASGNVTIPYPDLAGLNRQRAWPYYLDMTITQYADITSF